TLELEDRYIIEPVFLFWNSNALVKSGAKNVPEDFSYSSDNNSEWLDAAGLQFMLADSGYAVK
ncbi:MAG TPA: hypothetical protein VFS88_10125, partial [Micavibrio sp.]|nr:hypothetical protein [Micavibrio sp.]